MFYFNHLSITQQNTVTNFIDINKYTFIIINFILNIHINYIGDFLNNFDIKYCGVIDYVCSYDIHKQKKTKKKKKN